ncbi:MAG: hypothetical protein ACHQU0_02495 [Candidatus Paceibacteria bacterium]
MNAQPLQPFSPPTALFSQLHLSLVFPNFSAGTVTIYALYAVFAFWAIYTLVAVYHWLKYSHASIVAVPAVALHLALSIALMSYALSGNGLFLTPFLP